MVGLERSGCSPSCHVLKHGRLDLEEVPLLEEISDFGQHARSKHKKISAPLIRHEVQVSFAILDLPVGNSMPFIRHGTERFREDLQGAHFDGRLTLPGREGDALNSDPISPVEQLPDLPVFFGDSLFVQVALNATVHVADDKEDRFAHVSYGENSAGQSNRLIIHESLLEIESSSIGFESASERIDAEFAQAYKLLSTNSDELGFRGS